MFSEIMDQIYAFLCGSRKATILIMVLLVGL